MTFTWHFFTGGGIINPTYRPCHRGPMIDVEEVMSRPFTLLPDFEILRARLLPSIVDTDNVATQTREVVLRTLNSYIGPIFNRLADDKADLQVLICEKRRCVDIEADLVHLTPFFVEAARTLPAQDPTFNKRVDRIIEVINSNSPFARVAGKCALILLAAFIEMDNASG